MDTKVRNVMEEDSEEYYREASAILQAGGLVAFPTETVYGLGGNGLDSQAAKKIYGAKGRPSDNPLIIHIGNKAHLTELVSEVPDVAWNLADAFWPGPLTMILPKAEKVPYSTTGGLDTVAIRMPNHPVALRLLEESGIFIAAPSANTSGRPSPTLASHVYEDLNGKIDMILDGGMVELGLESTIVDLTEKIPVILRPGCISKEMLEKVAGEVTVDPAILQADKNSTRPPKAPGMKYKHYAPKAELTIVSGTQEKVWAWINEKIAENEKQGLRTGILATDESASGYCGGIVRSVGARGEAGQIARGLYKVLREFDHLQVDYIFAESFETDEMGAAIMNRLLKAAGYAVEKV